MNKNLLLPREKYNEVAEKYGEAPNTFEIRKDDQVLFYFGANHSPNPSNHQYPVLRKYWEQFLKETKGRDQIVLVEGNLRPVIENEVDAITKGSEGNLITLLAHQTQVPVACPDITSEELLEKLPQFTKDEVLLRWFLTWLNNFLKHSDPKPDFEQAANEWCEEQSRRKIWQGVKVNLFRLKELYKQVLGKEFDENDNPNNLINPNNTGTKINEIAKAQSNLRDLKIASAIERYWNEGKSIFIVFGQGHLIIQRPALEKALL